MCFAKKQKKKKAIMCLETRVCSVVFEHMYIHKLMIVHLIYRVIFGSLRLAPGRLARGLCPDARAAVSCARISNPRSRLHKRKKTTMP
jgi:hypothetical protein